MDDENREARRRVQGPATALIIVGVLSILVGLVFGLLAGAGALATDDPEDEEGERTLGVVLFAVVGLVQLLLGGVMVWGAISMLRLKSSALGLRAAIAAIAPCSCCFPAGLPVGVWAIVALNHPDVRWALQEARPDRY